MLVKHTDWISLLIPRREKRLPALTKKNAEFIEAVVHLDSIYGRDLDDNSDPEFGVKDDTNPSNLKGKYSGSTAYWFGQMKSGGESYEKCLLWAVTAIDRTNSTHLEAAQGGREKMRDIIKKRCPDVVSMKKELEKDFLEDPFNHLIATMCQELPMKGKEVKGVIFPLLQSSVLMLQSSSDARHNTRNMTMSLLHI